MRWMLTALLCLCPAVAHAQAFGVQMGQSADELDLWSKVYDDASYRIAPPEPNDSLAFYSVLAPPRTGVCVVTAASFVTPAADAKGLGMDLLIALEGLYGRRESQDQGFIFTTVPAPLLDVSLQVRDSGWVFVEYRFQNYRQCGLEVEAIKAGVDSTGL